MTALGDPTTYVDIEVEQNEVRDRGAPLLWDLVLAIQQTGSAVKQQVARDLFDRIADEVLWAATEILPDDKKKLLSQRFISVTVRDRWAMLARRPQRPSVKDFTRDSHGRVLVKHEHVVPRRVLKDEILAASGPQEVRAVLDRATGCVVTKEEDARLPKLGNGWDRYTRAGIRVFDRKEQREL